MLCRMGPGGTLTTDPFFGQIRPVRTGDCRSPGCCGSSSGRPRTPWESLGGTIVGAPAAVAWGAGRIDLFTRGVDNALVHKWWDGERWSDWENLGGTLSSGPAVAAWGGGRLDVFVRGSDNGLHHRWFTAGRWSQWEDLGGKLTIEKTKQFVGVGGIFNYMSEDHHGMDEQSLAMIEVRGGKWTLAR
jgi:hypothetical protein